VNRLRPVVAVAVGFGAASVPFSNLAARRFAGVDLRSVGSGTVSGSGLYDVAGKGPLVLVGLAELGKGALGPLVAGRDHPWAASLAGGAAVAGHNWSPLLRGAGGRGISPAMGALLVNAPAGSLLLLAGLAAGRLAGETALGSLLADLALVPVAVRAHGRRGGLAACAVLLPMLGKRLSGNGAPTGGRPEVYLWRLLFDRDSRARSSGAKGAGGTGRTDEGRTDEGRTDEGRTDEGR
jgi:glycerol-3-phosphate acyltransferase PlsY